MMQKQDQPNQQPQRGTAKYTIVKLVFLVVFIIEAVLCYQWLITPLMPLIRNIIAGQGVPSVNIASSGDIAHPLGSISVAGMSMQSMASLWIDTLIRIAVFSALFGITAKIKGLVMRAIS